MITKYVGVNSAEEEYPYIYMNSHTRIYINEYALFSLYIE